MEVLRPPAGPGGKEWLIVAERDLFSSQGTESSKSKDIPNGARGQDTIMECMSLPAGYGGAEVIAGVVVPQGGSMKRRTDKQRLDWLGRSGLESRGTISFTPQMQGGLVFWSWGGQDWPRGLFWRSLRQAIDAAMSAEEKR